MSLLDALAGLPDDAQVTVTVRKGDLVRALEERAGVGPATLTARQASATFGCSADQWKRWAAAGLIAGAWKADGGGAPWRLPRAACVEHVRRLQQRGAPPARPVGTPSHATPRPRSVPRAQRPASSPSYPAGGSRKQRGRARDAERARTGSGALTLATGAPPT